MSKKNIVFAAIFAVICFGFFSEPLEARSHFNFGISFNSLFVERPILRPRPVHVVEYRPAPCYYCAPRPVVYRPAPRPVVYERQVVYY